MSRTVVPRVAAALVIASACTFAFAQGSAAPAKGGKEGRTLSLGGQGAGGGPILTRQQLRDCLERQEAIARDRPVIEAERAELDAERQQIGQEQEALKGERAKLDSSRQLAESLNERYRELGSRVEAWNARLRDVAERTGPSGERGRKQHERERLELQKQQAQLDAEREQLTRGTEQSVDAFNARAQALDGRIAGWNQRNTALADRAEQLNADRDLWAGECANRRYREDDEILLKKGAR